MAQASSLCVMECHTYKAETLFLVFVFFLINQGKEKEETFEGFRAKEDINAVRDMLKTQRTQLSKNC